MNPVILTSEPAPDHPPLTLEPVMAAPGQPRVDDIVEEWGLQSFPASDPPANW